jgi:hypothetical protein
VFRCEPVASRRCPIAAHTALFAPRVPRSAFAAARSRAAGPRSPTCAGRRTPASNREHRSAWSTSGSGRAGSHRRRTRSAAMAGPPQAHVLSQVGHHHQRRSGLAASTFASNSGYLTRIRAISGRSRSKLKPPCPSSSNIGRLVSILVMRAARVKRLLLPQGRLRGPSYRAVRARSRPHRAVGARRSCRFARRRFPSAAQARTKRLGRRRGRTG